MSRLALFIIAAGAVVLAQYVDRGSFYIAQQQEIARGQADDNVLTGSTRRGSNR